VYGFPRDEGARVAVSTVADHLRGDTGLELVRFVLREETWDPFAAALREVASDHGTAIPT
jgi:O-acetyl-ADP-ribose deacetylase (regulator of RNase III)